MSTSEKRDVLDLLYEGGDESALSAAEQDELAAWRGVRGAMREVAATDAEPSASIAVLMAAARQREVAPRGVWARLRGWLSVMAAHPAMASAATVLLVGGVAGALYMSGRVGSAPSERAPAQEQIATGGQPAQGSGSVAPDLGAAPGVAGATKQRNLDTTPPEKVAPVVPAEPEAEEAEQKPAPTAPAVHRSPRPPATSPKPSHAVAAGAGHGGAPDLDRDGVADEDDVKAAADVPAPPPPPPPPPPTPTAEGAHVSAAKPSPPASAADLTRKAKVAAKKKDCKTVDAIGAQVRAIDEGYYRTSFAPDPDIRDNCANASSTSY